MNVQDPDIEELALLCLDSTIKSTRHISTIPFKHYLWLLQISSETSSAVTTGEVWKQLSTSTADIPPPVECDHGATARSAERCAEADVCTQTWWNTGPHSRASGPASGPKTVCCSRRGKYVDGSSTEPALILYTLIPGLKIRWFVSQPNPISRRRAKGVER